MTVRSRFAALGASTMVLAWLFAGCGSYDNAPKGTGGTGAGTGGTGGTTGGSAGAATGGSAGAATGGSAGAATGGSAGAATGGSAGAATGGSAGAATGGSAGSSGQAGSGAGAPGGAGSGAGAGGASGGSGGSGGQAAACTETAPCGGDVVGTWVTAGSGCGLNLGGMANLVPAGLGCTEAPIVGSVTVSGSWTATSDGMFMDATTTVGNATMELAAACLMISGFAAECDRLNLDSAGLLNVTCVDNPATQGCTCAVPIDQSGGLASVSYEASVDAASSGTYTTADNKVTTTASMAVTEYAYCVAASTLTMTVTSHTNAGTVTGPIVLQKQ